MTILERIYREPAALLALAGAIFTVLTATGVLTQAGAAIALGVVTAFLGALRYLVTPSAEVVAQRKPGAHAATAGPAAYVETGAPVVVRPLLEE